MGVLDAFSNFLERLGGKTIEVTEKPLSRLPEGKSVQERLRAVEGTPE